MHEHTQQNNYISVIIYFIVMTIFGQPLSWQFPYFFTTYFPHYSLKQEYVMSPCIPLTLFMF